MIYQYQKGYRFSIDAVILAGLTESTACDHVIDLGTGCAVVPLILGYRGKAKFVVGVEIQKELVELARKNVEENGFSEIVAIKNMDIKDVRNHFDPESFDVVVSNPPYRPVKTGRINPEAQKAIARHELAVTLDDLMAASAYLLKPNGTLSVIYPAWRLDDLIITAYHHDLTVKRLTCIHSRAGSRADLVHILARKKGGREMIIAPPLFVYEGDEKRYTEQMAKFYEP